MLLPGKFLDSNHGRGVNSNEPSTASYPALQTCTNRWKAFHAMADQNIREVTLASDRDPLKLYHVLAYLVEH
jgi:hypothetical protein